MILPVYSFAYLHAFHRAAAQKAVFVFREIGAGMDGGEIVPHDEIPELPFMLVNKLFSFAEVMRTI